MKTNGHQEIRCTVDSCLHNENSHSCSLSSIKVSPNPGCDTKMPEESMCASYEGSRR
ncbi:MAG: DUF1540 domain-containing protein [Christensenellales bacterium]